MRYLPCKRCNQPALATRSGTLHCTARLSSPTFTYLCRRCGYPTTITRQDFARLPHMSSDEIAHSTCDISPTP